MNLFSASSVCVLSTLLALLYNIAQARPSKYERAHARRVTGAESSSLDELASILQGVDPATIFQIASQMNSTTKINWYDDDAANAYLVQLFKNAPKSNPCITTYPTNSAPLTNPANPYIIGDEVWNTRFSLYQNPKAPKPAVSSFATRAFAAITKEVVEARVEASTLYKTNQWTYIESPPATGGSSQSQQPPPISQLKLFVYRSGEPLLTYGQIGSFTAKLQQFAEAWQFYVPSCRIEHFATGQPIVQGNVQVSASFSVGGRTVDQAYLF